METSFIDYRQSRICIHRFGSGPRLILAFHGYGEEGSSFSVLEGLLGNDYTLIAPDMPFHGNTAWKEGLLFTPGDLIAILRLLIPEQSKDIILFGYSMGGRICLQLVQAMPGRISRAILLAPDGLRENGWHWVSTQTWAGNRIFGMLMRHPRLLFTAMKLALRFKFLDPRILSFVYYYLDESQSRLLLYKRWTVFRRFRPSLATIKKIIAAGHTRLLLVFGRYDKVIPVKNGHAFSRGMEAFIEVRELESGHQLLKEKYAAEIAALFTA